METLYSGEKSELTPGFEYQAPVLAALKDARQAGITAGYTDIATGLGKTHMIACDIKDFLEDEPDARVLYLCHIGPILDQASKTFTKVLGTESHGQMYGGEIQDQQQVTFATFQTMGNKLDEGRVYEAFDPKEFDYIVVDEGHHGPAPTYQSVINYFEPKFLRGMTGTAERRDAQDISEIFGDPISTIKLEEAIAKGYLTPPDYHVLTDHIKQLETVNGKTTKAELEKMNGMVFVPKRDTEIVKTVDKHLEDIEDPRTVVFCSSVAQAEYFSGLFSGESAALHHGLTDKQKKERLDKFRTGELNTLVTVDMLNEGIDVPEINSVVFLRSTESAAVFFQQLGRGLRKYPGKDKVTVLDFVASWDRLNTLQRLDTNIRDHVSHSTSDKSGKPREISTDISFNFSSESLDAIKLMTKAREKAVLSKELFDDLDPEEQNSSSEAVMSMLGLDSLPPQTISRSEWKDYYNRIVNDDESAKEELLMRNIVKIYQKAQNYTQKHEGEGFTIEDSFQWAIEGYYRGISGTNLSSTEALRQGIVSAISKSFAENNSRAGLANLPSHVMQKTASIEKFESLLAERLGTTALDADYLQLMTDATGLSSEVILATQQIHAQFDYNNIAPIDETVENIPEDIDVFEITQKKLAAESLRRIMAETLSYRENRILILRNGLDDNVPHTLDEAGSLFGFTRERVRQIENLAMRKLKADLSPLIDMNTPGKKQPNPELGALIRAQNANRTALAEYFDSFFHTNTVYGHYAPEPDPFDPYMYHIAHEEGGAIAGMAYLTDKLAWNMTRGWERGESVNKDQIIKFFRNSFSYSTNLDQDTFTTNYGDFIKALNAMEKHGRIAIKRNERGTVIESIKLV